MTVVDRFKLRLQKEWSRQGCRLSGTGSIVRLLASTDMHCDVADEWAAQRAVSFASIKLLSSALRRKAQQLEGAA
jgi:hypothetical protein